MFAGRGVRDDEPSQPSATNLIQNVAEVDGNSAFREAPCTGKHVRLRTITTLDYGLLQAAELSPEVRHRWRYGGTTPSPENWPQVFWQGVLAQFLVVRTRGEESIGLVNAYGPNFQHGWAYVGATKLQPADCSPYMMLGLAIFIEYVFCNWNFRKIYLELPEFNYPQFRSGEGRIFVLEGRLKQHSYYDGRLWDQMLLAIHRDAWYEAGRRFLALEGLA